MATTRIGRLHKTKPDPRTFLACVVADDNHRKVGAVFPFGDILKDQPRRQVQAVSFLASIDAKTPAF